MISWWQRWKDWWSSSSSVKAPPSFDAWLVGWLILGFLCLLAGGGLTYQIWWEERQFQVLPVESVWSEASPAPTPESAVAPFVVAVVGAVKKPGVYRLSMGSRVHDVVLLAGGFTQTQASPTLWECLKLARPIQDGETIVVPGGEEPCQAGDKQALTPSDQTATEERAPLLELLNTASVSKLEQLPNIGEKRAAEIMKGRPYLSMESVRETLKLSEKMWSDLISFDDY